ncbi:HDOD domain-containing protein [Alcaligenaceae bacterium CGII-47]|nr:HDOD domain-containing protein [Alcaligenaceae bacterium CGII-47]
MDEQTESLANSSPDDGTDLLTPDYLIRREPVLDKERSLVGYTLKVLWPDGIAHDPAPALIEQCGIHSPERLMGRLMHTITASPALLQNAYRRSLPMARAQLDIPEGSKPEPELLQNISAMSVAGYRFTIRADLAANEAYAPFVPLCKGICFDLRRSTKAELFRESFLHKQAGRVLTAAHVPDPDTLDTCKLLGFTHFQGPWPQATPNIGTTTLTKKQAILLKLISLILGDGDGQSIKACMEQDPDLVQTLLRMVNTPAFGLSQEVNSLNQAILLLGRRQLQRWIQVLMYTQSGGIKGALSPMLVLATARGRLLEQLAEHEYPDQTIRSETAFSVGALSVMDQLFGGSLQDLLDQITVDIPVRSALLTYSGPFGDDLKLAECLFPTSSLQSHDTAPLLGTRNTQQINDMVQNAFEWGHSITQSAQ